jgi:hypothetical protein
MIAQFFTGLGGLVVNNSACLTVVGKPQTQSRLELMLSDWSARWLIMSPFG